MIHFLIIMSLFTQGARALTLLVASRADPASVVLFNSLIKHKVFDNYLKPQEESLLTAIESEEEILLSHKEGQFFLWLQNERLLNVNHINEVFEKRASLPPSSGGVPATSSSENCWVLTICSPVATSV